MTDWPKALNERYFIDEFSSFGKFKLIKSKLKRLDKFNKILNIFQDQNNLSQCIKRHLSRSVKCEDSTLKELEFCSNKYDLIILYDVIDHVEREEEIIKLLNKCKSILSCEGKIFLMCHPYISRLGTHLFEVNKAYYHLFYDCLEQKHTILLQNPLESYRNFVYNSFLAIEDECIYSEYIEDFFNKISIETDHKPILEKKHEIQFVTYVLKKTNRIL